MGILKGFLSKISTSQRSVTVSEDGDKIGLDVSVVGGAALDTIRDAEQVNVDWDYYDIAYVTAGNGLGEVESITYYTGTAPSGTLALTITFTYDASNNVIRAERS